MQHIRTFWQSGVLGKLVLSSAALMMTVICSCLCLSVAAVGNSGRSTPTVIAAVQQPARLADIATSVPTSTPLPTNTAEPTVTPPPTATYRPTRTPEPTATLEPAEGRVTSTAYLRSSPEVNDRTVIGQVCATSGIRHLETKVVGSEIWYRVRVVEVPSCTNQQAVAIGAEGWVSGHLLTGMEAYAERVANQLPHTATAVPVAQPQPLPASAPQPATGGRVGAVCRDGSRSSATGRGACSHHGGVDHWLYGP